MNKLASFIKVTTQPGKREEVRELWEKYVKPHQESEGALDFCCYCYATEDEDTICLFELLSDPSTFSKAMQTEWFAAYRQELKPLLAGPPEIITATPIWAKGISL